MQLGEGNSPFEVLLNGLARGIELDDETILFAREETAFELTELAELPAAIRESDNNALIAFLLDMRRHFEFMSKDDAYADDAYFYDILPEFAHANFLFGWTANLPREEVAYALMKAIEA